MPGSFRTGDEVPEMRGDARGTSVYRLKITLHDVEPKVVRRIEVYSDTTLPRLHRILQVAMGWDDSHLHAFTIDGTTYGTPDRGYGPKFVSERGVRLADVVTKPKQRFRYEYDFGDGWLHDIVLESIQPVHMETTYPRFVDGRNACPPDDVGGPPGYETFVEAVTDPSHEEHERVTAWSGGRFDPTFLDVAHIEAAFARLAVAEAKRTSR